MEIGKVTVNQFLRLLTPSDPVDPDPVDPNVPDPVDPDHVDLHSYSEPSGQRAHW